MNKKVYSFKILFLIYVISQNSLNLIRTKYCTVFFPISYLVFSCNKYLLINSSWAKNQFLTQESLF